VAALAVAAVALQFTGRGVLAAPPLTEPSRWAAWLEGRDPVIAAFAIVRVAALVVLWYLMAVTAVGLLLRAGGAVRMVAVADRLTIAPVRRALAGAVSLGLASSGLLAIATPASRLPVAAAAQGAATTTSITSTSTTSTSTTSTSTTMSDGAGTVTMHQLAPSEPIPAPSPAVPSTDSGRTPDRWTVVTGQCFWSIAERVLAAHLGHEPGAAEIVPYWRRLIDANRSVLAHRDNPDLIFPGQVFEVPAP